MIFDMKVLGEWVLRALILLAAAYLVPGFRIDSVMSALVVVLVIGVLNLLLRPVLIIMTLPLTVLTIGLFTFVINAILLELASAFVPGFHIESFMTAIVASIVITLISALANRLFR